jgi:hypothetical protein
VRIKVLKMENKIAGERHEKTTINYLDIGWVHPFYIDNYLYPLYKFANIWLWDSAS